MMFKYSNANLYEIIEIAHFVFIVLPLSKMSYLKLLENIFINILFNYL